MTMSNSESRKRLAATPDPDPHAADWLPAHDAKVAARALRDWISEWPTTPNDGTFLAMVARAGRARADEIERAGRAGGGS